MLAWAPPEIAAAGIPIVPRTAECTISRSLADTQVFSARGRAMVECWPEWDLSYEREAAGELVPNISMSPNVAK